MPKGGKGYSIDKTGQSTEGGKSAPKGSKPGTAFGNEPGLGY